MERKFHVSNGFEASLQRSNRFPRRIVDYKRSSSSSIPRLPPISKPNYCGSSPPTVSRRQPEKIEKGFSLDYSAKKAKQELLPKLDRSQFETTTVYFKVHSDTPNNTSRKTTPKSQLESQVNGCKQNAIPKHELPTSNSILGMRRKKKDRLSSYKCSANNVIDDEISRHEQRMGFEAAISTANPKCVKDMKGRMIYSGDVYNDGVSSLINMVDIDEDEKSKSSTQKDCTNNSLSPVPEQKRTALRQRFLKALDVHFFNEFVNSNSGRRMAICEELEKDTDGDGKTSLTGLREHLRLQDVLDSWVL